jgi:iron(III) transport system substrate-binding protein
LRIILKSGIQSANANHDSLSPSIMNNLSRVLAASSAALVLLAACGQGGDSSESATDEAAAPSEARVVNVYTSRHYDSDEAVYAAFTEATGIEINLLEARGDQLIERLRAEGERTPADVFVTVDAARLHRAEAEALFAPQDYAGSGVPANMIDPDGYWVGFAKRARILAVSTERVAEGEITTYEELADPAWRGRVCTRGANSPYNQSLLAAIIAHNGEEAAEAWAAGVVANLARPPQGGDRDQIRAIAAGECDVAITNHYYYAMLAASEDAGDRAAAAATRLLFPGQDGGNGAHVNITGAGIVQDAPHPEEARAFIDFMLSDEAQRLFAELSNEYPAMPGAQYDNPVLDSFGEFTEDDLNISALGDNNEAAVRIFDRVGWP